MSTIEKVTVRLKYIDANGTKYVEVPSLVNAIRKVALQSGFGPRQEALMDLANDLERDIAL